MILNTYLIETADNLQDESWQSTFYCGRVDLEYFILHLNFEDENIYYCQNEKFRAYNLNHAIIIIYLNFPQTYSDSRGASWFIPPDNLTSHYIYVKNNQSMLLQGPS